MPVDSKLKSLKDAEEDLALVDALWGGTRKMREAGVTYLPKAAAEDLQDWKARRDRSVLTNFFKKTVKVMAGRLFEDTVTVQDTSPAFVEFAENVDLEGRNLHRFAYDTTQKTIRDGLRFLVVDAPSSEGVTTAAEERAAGIRPYFVEVDIRNVLGWKSEDIGGNRIITQFRYIEQVADEVDMWTDEIVEQIRVIEPGMVSLYRKDQTGNWNLYGDPILTSIDFCPVVPLYAGRQGFMEAEPPMMDLAWLNVAHWQSDSDQRNILHYTRAPILHWAGGGSSRDDSGKEVQVTVGPGSLARSADPQAKLEYVEPQGAAIGHGRQDLIDLETRAIALGADYATPRKSGDITATEAAINESGDVSDLSAMAQNIKDSLELAFDMVGRMTGKEFTGYVTLNTDLGIAYNGVNVPELVKLRALGDLSREGLFEVLNGMWDLELDADKEAERLEFEGGSSNDGDTDMTGNGEEDETEL
jgi:hypothetical protein